MPVELQTPLFLEMSQGYGQSPAEFSQCSNFPFVKTSRFFFCAWSTVFIHNTAETFYKSKSVSGLPN